MTLFGRASKVRCAQEMPEVRNLEKVPRDPRRAQYVMSEETRQRMRESALKRGKRSVEVRQAISEGHKKINKHRRRINQVGFISLVRKFQGIHYRGYMKCVGRLTFRFSGWVPMQILTMELRVKKGHEVRLREELENIGLKRRSKDGVVWCLDSSIVFLLV